MQVNPEREFEVKTDTTPISLANVNDTFTAPSAGVISGFIRCNAGATVGYIQFSSSTVGTLKCVHSVYGAEKYSQITLPLEKGEVLNLYAKVDLDGGFYGFFTAFGV